MAALVDALMQGIARFEGFYTAGSVAQRNNNPGNIRTWGTLPRDANGYVIFPSLQAGWDALRRQVSLNISRGLDLYGFFGGKEGVYGGYAPAADKNAPAHYAEVVAGWLGIRPDVPLSQAGETANASPPDNYPLPPPARVRAARRGSSS